MTARELIKELQKYDLSLHVHSAYDGGTGGEVIRVFKEEDIDSSLVIYISEDKE